MNPPLTLPKAKANPKSHQAIQPTLASNKFLIKMLLAFFCLIEPHSTKAKPSYMKKIMAAEVKTQTALIAMS
jgi:hypothetical protein